MDYNLPGSSVHGILQTRILEWVAMPFSRGSSQPRDPTQIFSIAGGFFTVWATREAWSSALTVRVSWLRKCVTRLASSCRHSSVSIKCWWIKSSAVAFNSGQSRHSASTLKLRQFEASACSFQKSTHKLPWGLVIKNLPANPGDMGLILAWGWFHMLWGNWAQVLESASYKFWTHMPQLLKPKHPGACALQQEKPSQWEALLTSTKE